ncbi:hypothetical protein I3843_12G086100 [Carya illinoinensis]|uniref:Glycosyltransferase 2-like domain-containing protein n=1 Tax=Carya illinoinensis TaxID=32201 RepID=A0A922IX60_CARIL|nr:uncharacterized protein LOC122290182 [Carya illinoinensis]KAG6684879.1 hypothetical protein I3842_12G085200 [Carya illinoinensis]KAG7952958.1 hypothetical protein I3843_12G086100 [Carya illinoinensis]
MAARGCPHYRVIRDGCKAGNLKFAMNCSYVKDYEFVAIFDADFQPNLDFLKLTVPYFKNKGPWYSSMRQMEACKKSFTAQKRNRMCFRGEDEGRDRQRQTCHGKRESFEGGTWEEEKLRAVGTL